MKAKILAGECVKFPYSEITLNEENPNSNFDDRFSLVEWFNQTNEHLVKGFVLEDVEFSQVPSYDPLTQSLLTEKMPVKQNGKWVLNYVVVNLTPEQISQSSKEQAG